MLRQIISVYKALFLISCGLTLMALVVLGVLAAINGPTPMDRALGMLMTLAGALGVVFAAGNFALAIENNELLHRIVAQGERGPIPGQRTTPNGQEPRSEPSLRRKEPVV